MYSYSILNVWKKKFINRCSHTKQSVHKNSQKEKYDQHVNVVVFWKPEMPYKERDHASNANVQYCYISYSVRMNTLSNFTKHVFVSAP